MILCIYILQDPAKGKTQKRRRGGDRRKNYRWGSGGANRTVRRESPDAWTGGARTAQADVEAGEPTGGGAIEAAGR